MPSTEFSILLVEDEPMAARKMKSLLQDKLDTKKFVFKENAVKRVRVAGNQKEVDEEIDKNGPFDLIILDLKYPDRDDQVDDQDLQGMKWLAELSAPHRSAIVIQTSHPGDDLIRPVVALRDFDVDDFIPKELPWPKTEERLAQAWSKAVHRSYNKWLKEGYESFLESRMFRAVAEDARDEVFRGISRFRNLAGQLSNGGDSESAELLLSEYNQLTDRIVQITNPVGDGTDRALETVSLAGFLEHLQLFHRTQCTVGNITISVVESHGEVRTYERDLRTALHEVIENAVQELEAQIKAGRSDHGLITLSSRTVTEPRRGVEIIVADDGSGFSPQQLANPFQAQQTSTKGRQGGGGARGMGLYVSLRLINRIFGSITVRNRPSPGHGAEVILFVPDLGTLVKHYK